VSRRAALFGAAVALATASAGVAVAAPSPSGVTHRNVHVCDKPAAGAAGCHAIRHETLDAHGKPAPPPTGDPNGYDAASIRDAYNLPTGTGNPTVAVVDAYHLPNSASDLNTYRAANGLSAMSGTTTPWFKVVNQRGDASPLPAANTGWGQEIALDIEMVSAACPNCNILLVEADSAYFSDLRVAVAEAGNTPGVVAISNSYGGSESSPMPEYNQSGKDIAVTVSTGDSGYGVQSPASFPFVTAVGGTSLVRTSGGGFAETAWKGAGSGCARYTAKQPYQDNTNTGCARRAVADVSAVADPNTGVAVYVSYNSSGWLVFGGTSASAPIIAGVYALDGNGGGVADLYGAGSSYNDVTRGANGKCGRTAPQLCTAGAGWDGPTGLGTPNGLGAF
jgi:hypothetical protein